MIRFNYMDIEFSPFEEQLLLRLAKKHGTTVDGYIYDCVYSLEDIPNAADVREAVISHWRRVFPVSEIQETMEEVSVSCQEMAEKSDGVFIDQLFKLQGVKASCGHTEVPFSPRIYCGPNSQLYILVEGPASQTAPTLVPLVPGEEAKEVEWDWEFASRQYQINEEEGIMDEDPFAAVANYLFFRKTYDGSMQLTVCEGESIGEADVVIDRYYPDGMK